MIIKYIGSILYINIILITYLHLLFTECAKIVLFLDKIVPWKALEKVLEALNHS